MIHPQRRERGLNLKIVSRRCCVITSEITRSHVTHAFRRDCQQISAQPNERNASWMAACHSPKTERRSRRSIFWSDRRDDQACSRR